jgi:hypothetical protein
VIVEEKYSDPLLRFSGLLVHVRPRSAPSRRSCAAPAMRHSALLHCGAVALRLLHSGTVALRHCCTAALLHCGAVALRARPVKPRVCAPHPS